MARLLADWSHSRAIDYSTPSSLMGHIWGCGRFGSLAPCAMPIVLVTPLLSTKHGKDDLAGDQRWVGLPIFKVVAL